jgi:hypothetical protein
VGSLGLNSIGERGDPFIETTDPGQGRNA